VVKEAMENKDIIPTMSITAKALSEIVRVKKRFS
jgi:hypothetical protein